MDRFSYAEYCELKPDIEQTLCDPQILDLSLGVILKKNQALYTRILYLNYVFNSVSDKYIESTTFSSIITGRTNESPALAFYNQYLRQQYSYFF